jgi:hypothetical protein
MRQVENFTNFFVKTGKSRQDEGRFPMKTELDPVRKCRPCLTKAQPATQTNVLPTRQTPTGRWFVFNLSTQL